MFKLSMHLKELKECLEKQTKKRMKGSLITKQNIFRVQIIKRLKYSAVTYPGSMKFRSACIILE